MKIMLVGGGSGGHLTPIIAVASSIKAQDGSIDILHVGQKGEDLQEVIDNPVVDQAFHISAGKFRRYHGESFISHLFDFKTIALNVRDVFRVGMGVAQAWRLLGREKPDVIMLKGGFVCVPLGYAARFRNIPYITHDSDAIPGLANRLTAAHAIKNTTALPAKGYPYDQSKTVQVGVPLQPQFAKKVTAADKKRWRKDLDIAPNARVVFSVGGGLGAQVLNQGLVKASNTILDNEDTVIIHLTGKKLYQETLDMHQNTLTQEALERVRVIDFSTDLYMLSGAADVVITRAGATNIAEFAAQAKPIIAVPAPHLTGGQQLHNAAVLEKHEAAVILQEEQLSQLADTVLALLEDTKRADALAAQLHTLAVPGSSDKLADILIDIAQQRQ